MFEKYRLRARKPPYEKRGFVRKWLLPSPPLAQLRTTARDFARFRSDLQFAKHLHCAVDWAAVGALTHILAKSGDFGPHPDSGGFHEHHQY